MELTTNEGLEKSLEKMPFTFSSNMFIDVAKKYGIHQVHINASIVSKFLLANCNRISGRTWSKKQNKDLVINFPEKVVNFKSDLTEENCIRFLKSRNYKIYKMSEI
jgi:hypothetical protein